MGSVSTAARNRLGVLGWPVGHSRSPAMQNAALEALGLSDWRYQVLPVPPEAFAETVRALPALGFRGANVTIPHKEAALALADEATPRAAQIGAANSLTFTGEGRVAADNTDAPGLIAALPEVPTPGSSALILGAGGSARAAAWALREIGVRVSVWNRNPRRAVELAADLGVSAVERTVDADLLVHCTAAGLEHPSSTFIDLPLSPEGVSTYATVVDLVYRPGGTALIDAAREGGSAIVDGLEVLVRQGALSLEAWTGLPAPVDVMRAAARGGSPDDDTPRNATSAPGDRSALDGGGTGA